MKTIWLFILGLEILASSTLSATQHTKNTSEDQIAEYIRSKRQVTTTQLVYNPAVQQLRFSFPFNWPFDTIIPHLIKPVNVTSQISTVFVPKPSGIVGGISSSDNLAGREDNNLGGCGKTAFYRNPSWATTRIVDGEMTYAGEVPWLVSITGQSRHICGGSLISDQFVLSAGHCFAGYGVSEVASLRILIGDYNIYDPTDVGHQVRRVVRMIRHSKWNIPSNFNDVALLKLDKPVQFNKYVQPVCLPRGNEVNEPSFYNAGTLATVAGWGKIQFGDSGLQQTPLKITVPVIDKTTCQNFFPYTIADSMVCAGSGFKSTCLGDSGGPLSVNSNGKWYQIGIVSWGLNCNGYSVYTRVNSFIKWIDKHTRK